MVIVRSDPDVLRCRATTLPRITSLHIAFFTKTARLSFWLVITFLLDSVAHIGNRSFWVLNWLIERLVKVVPPLSRHLLWIIIPIIPDTCRILYLLASFYCLRLLVNQGIRIDVRLYDYLAAICLFIKFMRRLRHHKAITRG